MITDKLASYSAAKREVMPGVEHRRHRGLNNRAENLYGTFGVKRSLFSYPPAAVPRLTTAQPCFGLGRSEESPP